MNTELKQNLNVLVANFTVMYMKLHHFHWFVKGENFFTLHEKFEELYDEVTGHLDDVAERLLTLQEKPVSTLKECLDLATVKETNVIGTAKEMVQETIDDLLNIDEQLKKGIDLSAQDGDDVTNDLLVGISGSLQKHVWMLRFYMG